MKQTFITLLILIVTVPAWATDPVNLAPGDIVFNTSIQGIMLAKRVQVLRIDLKRKAVEVRDLETGMTLWTHPSNLYTKNERDQEILAKTRKGRHKNTAAFLQQEQVVVKNTIEGTLKSTLGGDVNNHATEQPFAQASSKSNKHYESGTILTATSVSNLGPGGKKRKKSKPKTAGNANEAVKYKLYEGGSEAHAQESEKGFVLVAEKQETLHQLKKNPAKRKMLMSNACRKEVEMVLNFRRYQDDMRQGVLVYLEPNKQKYLKNEDGSVAFPKAEEILYSADTRDGKYQWKNKEGEETYYRFIDGQARALLEYSPEANEDGDYYLQLSCPDI